MQKNQKMSNPSLKSSPLLEQSGPNLQKQPQIKDFTTIPSADEDPQMWMKTLEKVFLVEFTATVI